jgi:hypothetical protein
MNQQAINITLLPLLLLLISQCFGADPSCKVSENGKNYDLSPLGKPGGEYEVPGSNGRTFVLNICNTISTTITGISAGSAAALKYPTPSRDLGRFTSSPYVSGGDLVLVYGEGDNCTTGGKHKTVLHFICNKQAGDGLPKAIYYDDCATVFSWTSDKACPLNEGSMSGTSVAFLLLFLIFSIYFLGGVFYNRYNGKFGWELIPNIEFWRSVWDRLKSIKIPFLSRRINLGQYDRVRQTGTDEHAMFSDAEEEA